MTQATLANFAGAPAVVSVPAWRKFLRLLRRPSDLKRARKTCNHVQELPPHLLIDIGLDPRKVDQLTAWDFLGTD